MSFSARLIFLLLFNKESAEISAGTVLVALLYGLRFDLSAFGILFSVPFLILCYPRLRPTMVRTVWYLVLIICFFYFVFSFGDIIFYSISHRRAAAEMSALFASFKDFQAFVTGSFLYLILGVPAGIAPFYFLFRKRFHLVPRAITAMQALVTMTLWLFVVVVMVRGGLQGRPLNVAHAFVTGDYFLGNVTLNPVFAFLKLTYTGEKMPVNLRYGELDFTEFQMLYSNRSEKFTTPEYPFYRSPRVSDKMLKKNVVIFVMESWSAADMGYYNNSNGATPNFDAIAKEALVFDNAFAVGSRSITAIPVIVSSVTSLFGKPYTTSSFANNRQRGMGEIFREQGYDTIFVAGYKAGAQGFSPYMKVAGFDSVYTREKLGLGQDKSDGVWGIYDEYTFEKLHEILEQSAKPFLAVTTSLHPHHPYKLPENYAEKVYYKGIDRANHFNALRYSDYALGKFFAKARKAKYFKDTIFVITSDHTYTQKGVLAKYHIPIVFYAPEILPPQNRHNLASQLDILPTLIEMLRIPGPQASMGKSLLALDAPQWAIIDLDTSMGFLQPPYALLANSEMPLGIYHLQSDHDFSHDLLRKNGPAEYAQLIKTWYTVMNHISRSVSRNRIAPPVQ